MTKTTAMNGTGQKATRKNTKSDRLRGHGSVAAIPVSLKRQGSGKNNWGRPGDEMFEDPIDEYDPSYDSAEELLERAFGEAKKNAKVDWAALDDISAEDGNAMDEIEDAMRSEWMDKVEKEYAEIEEEGEAFVLEK